MDSALIFVGAAFAFSICIFCVGLMAYKVKADRERARDVLQDYMWRKGARKFFGVEVGGRPFKKHGVVFDDCPEGGRARSISEHVL